MVCSKKYYTILHYTILFLSQVSTVEREAEKTPGTICIQIDLTSLLAQIDR